MKQVEEVVESVNAGMQHGGQRSDLQDPQTKLSMMTPAWTSVLGDRD